MYLVADAAITIHVHKAHEGIQHPVCLGHSLNDPGRLIHWVRPPSTGFLNASLGSNCTLPTHSNLSRCRSKALTFSRLAQPLD